jgi:hypothetical protein
VIGLSVIASRPVTAQVVSGSYVGDGNSGRKITGLGFRPDFVLVKGSYSDATLINSSAAMRTSTMNGDASKPAIQDFALATGLITSIDADGFTLGGDQRVARSATTFNWAAFKANANMKVGSYTGNGTADGDSQAITGLGFSPDFLIVMGSNGTRALQACSATPAGRSYEFDIARGWQTRSPRSTATGSP